MYYHGSNRVDADVSRDIERGEGVAATYIYIYMYYHGSDRVDADVPGEIGRGEGMEGGRGERDGNWVQSTSTLPLTSTFQSSKVRMPSQVLVMEFTTP